MLKLIGVIEVGTFEKGSKLVRRLAL